MSPMTTVVPWISDCSHISAWDRRAMLVVTDLLGVPKEDRETFRKVLLSKHGHCQKPGSCLNAREASASRRNITSRPAHGATNACRHSFCGPHALANRVRRSEGQLMRIRIDDERCKSIGTRRRLGRHRAREVFES